MESHGGSYGFGCSVEAKKWMNLIGVLWIQALSGTNFDFSGYSSALKQVLQISQVQLNNLAVASDLGKVLGWISGYAIRRMPLWAVLLIATSMGLVGYGVQWLVITQKISLNYSEVYLLCFLAGNSICWLNTVGFILCIRNFPTRKAMALAISTSYNGLTAAVFTLIVKAMTLADGTLYLLLNAVLPLVIGSVAFTFIRQIRPTEDFVAERRVFVILNIIAIVLGFYLLPVDFFSLSSTFSYKMYAVGMVVLLLAPLCIPATIYARNRKSDGNGYYSRISDDNDNNRNDVLGKLFHISEEDTNVEENAGGFLTEGLEENRGNSGESSIPWNCSEPVPELGEEHNLFQLLRSVDFWLYFFVYFCGATLGLAYSNNLGQIAQSRGHSNSTVFVALYSSSAFFGRLMSAGPDYFPRYALYDRFFLALRPIEKEFGNH
uniref:Uncharacterized protein n=1 Tax=Araucaria cunninghamii TaxID=56994 RepID=A0A0D6R3M5_ARACU